LRKKVIRPTDWEHLSYRKQLAFVKKKFKNGEELTVRQENMLCQWKMDKWKSLMIKLEKEYPNLGQFSIAEKALKIRKRQGW